MIMRQRDILFFWFPLFASWLLMTAEGPIISAAINRLPDEVIMLAAMGIVMSLSVTIESPIINLLATSTALVKDEATYRLVRRFTVHWCIALTIVALLIAYTRLFDVIITGLLDVPAEVAIWVRPGMQIMVFWSAAIGWRRFLQGILIRYDHTRRIAIGTAVRLVASGGVVVLLALWGGLPGVVIGSIALMTGVLAEAAYITLVVQPVLRNEILAAPPTSQEEVMTYRQLFWFHLPLAATSFLILLMQPLVTSSLARLEQPTASLAAWPVVFQVLLMARAAALALPEVIIARYRDRDSFLPLRRFSYLLAIAVTVTMIVFSLRPLAGFYIFRVQDMTAEVGALALSSLPLFILFPALAVLISWLRGLLIHGHHTRYVNFGMVINLAITALVLILGVSLRWPGLPTAAMALNLAALSESVYLAWRTQSILPFDLRLFGAPKTQLSSP
jgi:progressive ankylosis protein